MHRLKRAVSVAVTVCMLLSILTANTFAAADTDSHTHTYEAAVTAPTCVKSGYTTHQCSGCGDSYVDSYVPATGHSFSPWTVTTEPDCGTAGEEARVCAGCGQTEHRPVTVDCPSVIYSDVPVGEWYHDAVDFVTAQGIMNGMDGGAFQPATTTNRAMMAVLLYRLAGEPGVEGLDHPFRDVPEASWFRDAVVWAYHWGIIIGVSPDSFAPAADLNRAQMVTMLYRYAGSPPVDVTVLDGYSDTTQMGFSADAFAWAIGSGVVTGMTETTLAPNGTANRAQLAVILHRYLSK